MKHLVIGDSSQLGRFFPKNYMKISSRDYNLSELSKRMCGSVYICFAEQRTYMAKSSDSELTDLFWAVNVDKPREIARVLQPCCERLVYFSTAELWNSTCGPVNSGCSFSYHANLYTTSKAAITDEFRNKTEYPNVSIVYPFNFNSIYRGGNYLFGKIFRSIIHNEEITIGDVDYYRELLHPSMIVDFCISRLQLGEDMIAGSGRLVHVGDFIRRLYDYFGLDFGSLVHIDPASTPSIYRQNIFYSNTYIEDYALENLFKITTMELKRAKEEYRP